MKKYILLTFYLLITVLTIAQEKDTLVPKNLNEIIVISKKQQEYQKQTKPLASIDEYLLQSSKVEMIKRGGYAWEPLLNSMATERTLVTIDGMRIFGACTDKMDPITSYVEVSNLSEASIKSGQQGACHGATIGGSIDLVRNRSGFSNSGWNATINSGFETNSKQKIIGSAVHFASNSFYFDTDFTHRNAENYTAGNGKEVLFSQFKKSNISTTSGFTFNKNKFVEASLIYDKATDVGYPALPMDVALAEALITSVKFEYAPKSENIASNLTLTNWETKIYYNTITHKMDDTKRPSIPVHMDMPGWSDTFGFYSKAKAVFKTHHFLADLNSFYNKSVAEMTMYPSNPNESLMFMYTWPDVRTHYSALFLEDNIALNCHSSLQFSTSWAQHSNTVANKMGLESLQIFYPTMEDTKTRLLKSFSTHYLYNENGISYRFGIGYGERAPSISEGYGFYLFNSFDRYDYIGNPDLQNEKSFESSASFGFATKKGSIKLSGAYFRIANYIVGKPDENLLSMTIGARGVKTITALDYATLCNADLNAEYQFSARIYGKAQLVYSYGKDSQKENLPFISPLRYSAALDYKYNHFSSEIGIQGNAVQMQFSPQYGEDCTADYAILNFSSGYTFSLEKSKWTLKTGVENMLDAYYSTFSDWNNIPRKGRNVFLNIGIGF